jgi:hypothetical protein
MLLARERFQQGLLLLLAAGCWLLLLLCLIAGTLWTTHARTHSLVSSGSSGRSWVTMQRFPDNILTGNAYGFALGMHCKDMDNAMEAILTPHPDGTHPPTHPHKRSTRHGAAPASNREQGARGRGQLLWLECD